MIPESKVEQYIAHVNDSIAKALRGDSKLDAETLALGGFSTATMQHLFNNLCGLPVHSYLEVGAYFGRSACAAMCRNNLLDAFVVENFSQDFSQQGVRDQLLKNLEAVRPKTGSLKFIEADCYEMDLALIDKPIQLFFFDGQHTAASQSRALPHFLEKMDKTFALVIDDWNWLEDVAKPTIQSLDRLHGKITIEKRWFLQGKQKQDDPTWHNGLAIFLITKI